MPTRLNLGLSYETTSFSVVVRVHLCFSMSQAGLYGRESAGSPFCNLLLKLKA